MIQNKFDRESNFATSEYTVIGIKEYDSMRKKGKMNKKKLKKKMYNRN